MLGFGVHHSLIMTKAYNLSISHLDHPITSIWGQVQDLVRTSERQ